MKQIFKSSNVTKVVMVGFLSTLVISPSNAFASTTSKSTSRVYVSKVQDVNVVVKQGDKYVLPSAVTASMNNGSAQKVSVVWNIKKVDTNKVGKCVFVGTVKGYSRKVNLVLTVQKYVKSVEDINVVLTQGDKYGLPGMVKAVMSDNSIQQVGVIWKSSKIDTNKTGAYVFKGTVKGYSKEVKATVVIKQSLEQKINDIKKKYGCKDEAFYCLYYAYDDNETYKEQYGYLIQQKSDVQALLEKCKQSGNADYVKSEIEVFQQELSMLDSEIDLLNREHKMNQQVATIQGQKNMSRKDICKVNVLYSSHWQYYCNVEMGNTKKQIDILNKELAAWKKENSGFTNEDIKELELTIKQCDSAKKELEKEYNEYTKVKNLYTELYNVL